MSDRSDLLMLCGVAATCADCGDERVFVPVDTDDTRGGPGAYCCTSCDAAVFLLALTTPSQAAAARVA
jgi:hypothetical protein